jgi:hypothetical protein
MHFTARSRSSTLPRETLHVLYLGIGGVGMSAENELSEPLWKPSPIRRAH